MRIKGYVGKLPQPRDLRGRRRNPAPAVRRAISQARAATTGWPARAAPSSEENGGWCRPTTSSSPRRWKASTSTSPLPPLWKQFDALGARAGDGDPRRQFRHPVAGHGRGDARAPRRDSKRSKCPTRATRRCWRKPDTIARIARFRRPLRPGCALTALNSARRHRPRPSLRSLCELRRVRVRRSAEREGGRRAIQEPQASRRNCKTAEYWVPASAGDDGRQAMRVPHIKNPGGFPPGPLSLKPHRSSGIEVAMHAEAEHQVVDVGCPKWHG